MNRRRAVLATVSWVALGACVGAVVLLTEFPTLAPNAPVPYADVPLGSLQSGAPRFFTWNNEPFVIVRPSDDMLDDLRAQTVHTWSGRPIPADRPALFVYSLVSPPFGCVARHAPKGAHRYAPERLWQGGFYDPCRFAEWDYAGRTIRQYPDQDESMRVADLVVPAFELRDQDILRVHR